MTRAHFVTNTPTKWPFRNTAHNIRIECCLTFISVHKYIRFNHDNCMHWHATEEDVCIDTNSYICTVFNVIFDWEKGVRGSRRPISACLGLLLFCLKRRLKSQRHFNSLHAVTLTDVVEIYPTDAALLVLQLAWTGRVPDLHGEWTWFEWLWPDYGI